MKKISLLIIIILIVPIASAASEIVLNKSNVRVFTQSFFDMMMKGDTDALRYLIDDEMLNKRKKLLSNPKYGEFLREYYKNCEFNILSITQLNGKEFEVVFEIRKDGETQSVHTLCFSLAKGNKVHLSREERGHKNSH